MSRMTLSELLDSVSSLPCKARHESLSAYGRSTSASGLREAADAQLHAGSISPADYAMLLSVSGNVEWAEAIVSIAQHQAIVVVATTILARTCFRTDANVDTTIKFIGRLPQFAVARLFRLAHKKKQKCSHAVIDQVLKAIYPFLNKSDGELSICPLERHARLAASTLLLSASPLVIVQVFRQCGEWVPTMFWNRLAARRPEAAAELLKDLSGSSVIPVNLAKPVVNIVMRRLSSTDFIDEFLRTYITRILKAPSERDCLGDTATGPRVSFLLSTADFILRRRTPSKRAVSKAQSFCDYISTLTKAGSPQLLWMDITCMLRAAVGDYKRSPQFWALGPSDVTAGRRGSTTDLLISVFQQLAPREIQQLQNPDPFFVFILEHLPARARFPFLNLYSTSIDGPDLSSKVIEPAKYPQISFYVLSLLHHDHGQLAIKARMSSLHDPYYPNRWGSSGTNHNDYCELVSYMGSSDENVTWLEIGWDLQIAVSGSSHTDESALFTATLAECVSKASRGGDDRHNHVLAALSLCVIAKSQIAFVKTLAWAVQRYAKDPDTGRLIFDWLTQTDNGFILRFLGGHVNLIEFNGDRSKEWCLFTRATFDALIQILRVWVNEPGYQSQLPAFYDHMGQFILKIIQARINFYASYLDSVGTEPWSADFALLIEMWMIWERFRVEQHPDILVFDSDNCLPMMRHDVMNCPDASMSKSLWSFVAELIEQREILYLRARQSLPDVQSKALQARLAAAVSSRTYFSSHRHVLPFDIKFKSGDASVVFAAIPSIVQNYSHQILFNHTAVEDLTDQTDVDATQFDAALRIYLDMSAKNDVAERVLELLQYHDSSGEVVIALLCNSRVQSLLRSDISFAHWRRIFLPNYPASPTERVALNFNPLGCIFQPYLTNPREVDARTPVAVLRMPKQESNSLIPVFLSVLSSWESSEDSDRITILIVAWVMTILQIPCRPHDGQKGAMKYAIDCIRLDHDFVKVAKTDPSMYISTLLPRWSDVDVQTFIDTVFSATTSPKNDVVQMNVLLSMRRVGPLHIIQPHMWRLIKDTDKSSWHRHTFTAGMLDHMQPRTAADLIKNLLSFSVTLYRKQVARTGSSKPVAEHAKPDNRPFIKMSTQKMFLQLLEASLLSGSLSSTLLHSFMDEGLLNVPTAIRSHMAQIILLDIRFRLKLVSPEDRDADAIWAPLAQLVNEATRLKEDKEVSGEEWIAARNGSGPMPVIDEHHTPIADTLLRSGVDPTWTRRVIEPLLLGQIRKRTKWLRAAVAREGGGVQLQESLFASCGHGIFDCTAMFQSCGQHFATLDIFNHLHDLLLIFHNASAFHNFGGLLAKNHPGDESYKDPYVCQVRSLMEFALTGSCNNRIATTFASVFIKVDAPPTLLDRAASSLKIAGETLLRSKQLNTTKVMMVPHSSYDSFFAAITDKFEHHKMPQQYHGVILHLLEIAQSCESEASQNMLNGGAFYWRIILILKLYLLHLASQNIDIVDTRRSVYSDGLLQIINIQIPWTLVDFPASFIPQLRMIERNDVPFICISLTTPPNCSPESGRQRESCYKLASMLLRIHFPRNSSVPKELKTPLISLVRDRWEMKDGKEDGSIMMLAAEHKWIIPS